MFGKLSLAAIPWGQPIPLITSVVIVVLLAAILALVTYKGWWPTSDSA
jgi:cytochrome o ubiquinol oxidase subunit 1